VKILDRCPNGCAGGRAFDLSNVAFSTIANLDVGVITVEYSRESSLDDEEAETFIAEVGHIGQ
jgi:rare lipoprotein A (peptidoglycan hydrolase)